MLIGICSDSHDRHENVRRAVEIFDRVGVERIVHCGDVGGPRVFEELAGRDVRFVWGNMDFPDANLMKHVKRLGIPLPESVPLILEWAGKRIAVFHGHEPAFRAAPESLEVDYVFYGHSHQKDDKRRGRVRHINPGALHRARVKTVATLDLATDRLTYFELPVE